MQRFIHWFVMKSSMERSLSVRRSLKITPKPVFTFLQAYKRGLNAASFVERRGERYRAVCGAREQSRWLQKHLSSLFCIVRECSYSNSYSMCNIMCYIVNVMRDLLLMFSFCAAIQSHFIIPERSMCSTSLTRLTAWTETFIETCIIVPRALRRDHTDLPPTRRE